MEMGTSDDGDGIYVNDSGFVQRRRLVRADVNVALNHAREMVAAGRDDHRCGWTPRRVRGRLV